MKRTTVVVSLGLAFAVLFFTAALLPSTALAAKPKVVAVEGVDYNVNASMADNLKALVGKKVYVSLNSGKTFTGFVKAVGDHLMHLEKLEGKDYFDALVRIEKISAIDTRFRKVQR